MKRLPHDSLPLDEFFRKKSLSLKWFLNGFCFDGRDRLFVYGTTDETYAPIRYDHCSLVGCYLPLSASRGR